MEANEARHWTDEVAMQEEGAYENECPEEAEVEEHCQAEDCEEDPLGWGFTMELDLDRGAKRPFLDPKGHGPDPAQPNE